MIDAPNGPLTDACRRIDALACGDGYAPLPTVQRSRAFHVALAGTSSLTCRIARALLSRPGGRVVLFTGFVVPNTYPRGENDGPLGAVALARALRRLGFAPEIHVDPEVLETVRWLLAELGAEVCARPIDSARPVQPESFDIAVAIEKPGRNAVGVMHTFDGFRIEGGSKSIDESFAAFGDAGKLTIAIGDQGNEVGFGLLGEAVGAINPATRTCTCGCGQGIAAATPAQYLVPAAVSNWGAYALVAALAILAGQPSLCLRPDEERRMLHVCAVRGCCDGVRRRGTFGIDGLSGDASIRVVDALRHLVQANLHASR